MPYQVDDRIIGPDDPDVEQVLAAAHAQRPRPRCLCQPGGIEMYVTRLSSGHVLKRMPFTGCQHAPDCPSFDLPDTSPIAADGPVAAISEDPDTGLTLLRLDFAMSKAGTRKEFAAAEGTRDSASTEGSRLSLRDLLHFLWSEAGLTRWRPEFAGKRTWAAVRRRLLRSVENKVCRAGPIAHRLYVPEPFSVDERLDIAARQRRQWATAAPAPGKAQRLMLLIAELKELQPARYGFKAVLKQVPDQAFALDEQLYRQATRRFEPELAMWATAADLRMIITATFSLEHGGTPALHELSLMPVTGQWLPVNDAVESQLIDLLVRDGRSFIKCRPSKQMNATPCAYLTDVGGPPMPVSAEPCALTPSFR